MKIIISYQDGRTEMYSIARVESMLFEADGSEIVIKITGYGFQRVNMTDVRSIVIA